MEKNEINSLKDLVTQNWWKVLKKELESEIKNIEKILFTVRGEKSNRMIYTEDDLLRGARNVYKTLLNTPDELINSFDIQEIKE